MTRGLFTLTAVLVVLAATAAPSVAAGFDPRNFDVQLKGGPEMQAPQPSCTQDEAGVMTCSSSYDYTATGQRMQGTVTERTTGLSGTIDVTCDWDIRQRQSFRHRQGAEQPEVVEFSGSGSQSCSWSMDFGASLLVGTMRGTMSTGLVASATQPTAFFGGTFSVVVVAGTGAFKDMVGSGVFNEYETFPLFGGEHGPRALASTAGDGSKMKVKLRRGRPLARISSHGPRVENASGASLRVATAPSAACRAVATRGTKRVDLGQAADGNRDGQVVFPGRLAAKLGRGTWRLTATCTYGSRERRGTATARALARIS